MNKIVKYLVLLCVLVSSAAHAQDKVEMADSFRAEGKIYVVLAMILIVLAGFIAYLVLIDRKISRLEKRLTDKDQR